MMIDEPAVSWPGSAGAASPVTGGPGAGAGGLSGRLTALARLVQIGAARTGPGGFGLPLLKDAEQLVARAGERLRMSSEHTIAVLAGGTGSGKSSLFNMLAGADFSPVGVTRPYTRAAHACVWGMGGAAPLLEWLGVAARNRYARSSALDEGESSLHGLILLDLPDHDSVVTGASGEVNRLIALADLMVWVLDPQKYADAAVHTRYLTPLAGHSSVMAVVLNQCDLLTADQAEDCESDLRRLLDSEGLHDVRVLLSSAQIGAGVEELRKTLANAVSARQAVSERIRADLSAISERFLPYAGEAGASGSPDDAARLAELPPSSTDLLAESFAAAAGVDGVGQALQSARELRAADYVGWPVTWLADRALGRDPVRKLRLGNLWDELRGVSAGPGGAQQAEINKALTIVADQIGPGLPAPWSQTVRTATRSRAEEIPRALGAAIGESLPVENSVEPWWRLVAAWQGLLLGCAVAGAAWLCAILAFGVFHAAHHAPAIISNAVLLPWIAVMIAAILGLGWLTASGSMNLVTTEANRERVRVEGEMRGQIAAVARQLVVLPVQQELSEYTRFCGTLREARG